MLVLQKHNTEMTVAAGEALYTLVCLHQVCTSITSIMVIERIQRHCANILINMSVMVVNMMFNKLQCLL